MCSVIAGSDSRDSSKSISIEIWESADGGSASWGCADSDSFGWFVFDCGIGICFLRSKRSILSIKSLCTRV